MYSFLGAEAVYEAKTKNKFPSFCSFLVCCCYQSVFVSGCSGIKTIGQKTILIFKMILKTTDERKKIQDFDQTEITASDKRKQFRETTKNWKEEAILQKTGMNYR